MRVPSLSAPSSQPSALKSTHCFLCLLPRLKPLLPEARLPPWTLQLQGPLRSGHGLTNCVTARSQAGLRDSPQQSHLPLLLLPLPHPSWHQAQSSPVPVTRPVCPFVAALSGQKGLRQMTRDCSENSRNLSRVTQHNEIGCPLAQRHLLAQVLRHSIYLPSLSTPGPALAHLWPPAPPFTQQLPGPPLLLPQLSVRKSGGWMGRPLQSPRQRLGQTLTFPFVIIFLINLRTALPSLLPPEQLKPTKRGCGLGGRGR